MNKTRRAFLADLFFLGGGLTAAALLINSSDAPASEGDSNVTISTRDLAQNFLREPKKAVEAGEHWDCSVLPSFDNTEPHAQGIFR